MRAPRRRVASEDKIIAARAIAGYLSGDISLFILLSYAENECKLMLYEKKVKSKKPYESNG
jgi:hypothetical protein